ncbi:MAG: endolytic transglycosylase MltG [Alphaproteobacteria bacterium]|nr:endolytic transglycosylase MltG [Alphaproteobacteria bacterium]
MGAFSMPPPGWPPFLPHSDTPPVVTPRRVWPLVAAGVFSALLVAVSLVGALVLRDFGIPGPLVRDRTVEIARGASLREIAHKLEATGVVDSATRFEWATRLLANGQPLKAGEYSFPVGISLRGSVRLLQSGHVILHALTIPEGLTSKQILALLQTNDALAGALPVPPGEGELMPETYSFARGDERAELVRRMRAGMDATLNELWDKRAAGLPLKSPREALILASIVEKETGREDERPHVAAVFINRLARGMRLQSDPTVVYGMTQGAGPLGRALTRADLARANPFNTYQVDGLPPGPISNPGRASLMAVLDPAQSKDLFFVADGAGGHAFAETLAQHERNVARWRALQQPRR